MLSPSQRIVPLWAGVCHSGMCVTQFSRASLRDKHCLELSRFHEWHTDLLLHKTKLGPLDLLSSYSIALVKSLNLRLCCSDIDKIHQSGPAESCRVKVSKHHSGKSSIVSRFPRIIHSDNGPPPLPFTKPLASKDLKTRTNPVQRKTSLTLVSQDDKVQLLLFTLLSGKDLQSKIVAISSAFRHRTLEGHAFP